MVNLVRRMTMATRVDAADEKHVSTSVNRAVIVAINAISPCDYTPESEALALGDEILDLRAVLVDVDEEPPEEDERALDEYLQMTG